VFGDLFRCGRPSGLKLKVALPTAAPVTSRNWRRSLVRKVTRGKVAARCVAEPMATKNQWEGVSEGFLLACEFPAES
jgi:hypothetical protein